MVCARQDGMLPMIDNPDKTEHLVSKLTNALPLDAVVSPQLANLLHDRVPGLEALSRCQISQIHYAGDEGGIVCRLDLAGVNSKEVFVVSITHLAFDRRLPLAREIAAYQKHRIKRIRREASVELN